MRQSNRVGDQRGVKSADQGFYHRVLAQGCFGVVQAFVLQSLATLSRGFIAGLNKFQRDVTVRELLGELLLKLRQSLTTG